MIPYPLLYLHAKIEAQEAMGSRQACELKLLTKKNLEFLVSSEVSAPSTVTHCSRSSSSNLIYSTTNPRDNLTYIHNTD